MKDYKKILEGVVNIISTTEKSDVGFANICTYIGKNCPELAESEDERIRKNLISYINISKHPMFSERERNEMLAWLEKQDDKDKLIQELGEYKVKYTQEVLEKHINSMSNKDDERLRKTTILFLEDFAEQGYENAVECIDWLEKQGEQETVSKVKIGEKYRCCNSVRYTCFQIGKVYEVKDSFDAAMISLCSDCFVLIDDSIEQETNDKVEPRFKDGDWIVFNGLTLYVNEVVQGYYRTISKGGIPNSYGWCIDNVARLWTIQEAKDGDVLVASDGSIFLFKGTIDCACIHYVALTTDGAVNFNKGLKHCWETSRAVHPATKEQREQLEKAMADAGYTFDFEKKELKKIEHEHICELDNSHACVKFPFKAKVKSSGTIVTIHDEQISPDGKKWIKYQSDVEDKYKVYEPNNLELVCEIE